jgi:hypothetical protein
MKELDPEADRRLARYLDQMRAALRGSRTVDPVDVEADVTAHIQSELASLTAPVTLTALDGVLERLGSPRRWVPTEEQSVWRQVSAHLRAGPEDWRLAYLCLVTFLGALMLAPVGLGPLAGALFLASYLSARAVITLFDESGEELGAQRWFVNPTLVFTHGLLLIALVIAPLGLLIGAAEEIVAVEAVRPRVPELVAKHAFLLQRMADANDPYDLAVGIKQAAHVLLGVLGPWLVLLGLLARTWPAAPARLFRPLLAGFRPRHANLILATGAAACVLAVLFYLVNA